CHKWRHRLPPLQRQTLRVPRLVILVPAVAPQLARDRAGMARQLPADLAGQETRTVKHLNLVALALAQVCVGHGQFHLAVKLRRLPRLRRFTGKELHFRMESARLEGFQRKPSVRIATPICLR
ncbi:MAG: hypothetical protein M3R20_01605, partial [Pseudomonadota bacterium]|nr:hypothetical protein [Pseudomonadota bacterium]